MGEQLSFIAPTMSPPPTAIDSILDAEFEEFRAVYPKRPNNPWKLARERYRAARQIASAAEILAGLARYRFSPDPMWRPMASTWLNQRRWQCEVNDLAADPWGIGEHIETLRGNAPRAGFSCASFEPQALYAVLFAAQLPETWRGDLDTLDAWLRDGYSAEGIASAIGQAITKHGPRSGLRQFDGWVRAHARRLYASE